MTYYVVVTRDKRQFVIDRFMSIEMAADKLVKERTFHRWTVLAQDRGRAAPMRELNQPEKTQLERQLYPTVSD